MQLEFPEGKDRLNGAEAVSEKRQAENFPKLMKVSNYISKTLRKRKQHKYDVNTST